MIPKMPEEYKGKELKKTQYVKNNPRKWTNEEIEWCMDLKNKGYTIKEIAKSIDREEISTSIKLKRLSKKDNTYNKGHIIEKYKTNEEYYKYIKPKTILDVFCGEKRFWNNIHNGIVLTNDKDTNIEADYHLDALKFLCKMFYESNKFDIVDLDPYGSCANCLELAIQLAQKGIIITIGEMGHKRFKRLDYVKRFYNIDNLEDFTSDTIIDNIISIGRKYKKELVVYKKCDWKGISRVWFIIKEMKITEQWS